MWPVEDMDTNVNVKNKNEWVVKMGLNLSYHMTMDREYIIIFLISRPAIWKEF